MLGTDLNKSTAALQFKSITILLSLLFMNQPGLAQWHSLALPNPDRRSLNSVFFTEANRGYIAGAGIILKTNDGGQNWLAVFSQPNDGSEGLSLFNEIFFTHPDTGFVAGWVVDRSRVGLMLRSNDQGQHWAPVALPVNSNSINSILNDIFFVNGSLGFAVGNRGLIFKTTNGGKDWAIAPSGVGADLLHIFMADSDTGYIAGQQDTFLKTVDSGESWTLQPLINPGEVFFTSPYVGYVGFSDPVEVSFYKTTDGGINWTYQLIKVGPVGNSIFFTSADTGYISSSGGIFRTVNAGQTWIQETYQSAGAMHFPEPAIGYAISEDSLYVRMANFTEVTDGGKTETGDYQLFINYPNPFNPHTTIDYAISQAGFVRLKVFDMFGREIRTLVSASRGAGRYSTHFDASGLAGGIYFYSLQVGNFKDMRKMLLLR